MWLLLVEAGVALFLLVFIVWWTMFQGPQMTHDEPHDEKDAEAREAQNKTDQR